MIASPIVQEAYLGVSPGRGGMSAALTLEGVHTHIGRYHILQGVDFDAPAGLTTMLLGRNGAGKTTTLRTIMGLWRASKGRIALGPTPLQNRAASDVARAWRRLCAGDDGGVLRSLGQGKPCARRARGSARRRASCTGSSASFPALKKFWLSRAGALSGGQKQMLSIARAIVEPRELLLIDEPTKGLAPAIVGSLIACLNEIKATGVTILMVEQNFRVAREVGDEVRVMDNGRIVHRGGMAELAADDALAKPPARPQPRFASMSALDAGAALPRQRMEILPALTPLVVALVAAPFIGSLSTFVTLTAAGLAMGMMIFTMASGLTLVFGMMDVLNFGHGAFIALGAYAATLVLLPLASWSSADSFSMNLAVFILAALVAALVCGAFGWVFERLIVKPVYGQHLKQILATIGGAIIAEQLLYAVFGPAQIPLSVPKTFEGSFVFGEAAIEKYRVLATLVGLAVFLSEMLILNRQRSACLSAPGSRIARWSRRSAIASTGCSWLCSWPARRWLDWAGR